MQKSNKKAFTMMEIVIVMALLSIVFLITKSLWFNWLSDRERSKGFFYDVKTNFETVQNNSLIGRSVEKNDGSIIVPKKWKFEINNEENSLWGYWSIKISYLEWEIEANNYKEYITIPDAKTKDKNYDKFYDINALCKKINDSWTWSFSWTWIIEIEWGKLTWTGAFKSDINCWPEYKEILITTKYKGFEEIFTINTISWVIEEKNKEIN